MYVLLGEGRRKALPCRLEFVLCFEMAQLSFRDGSSVKIYHMQRVSMSVSIR